MTDTTVTQTQYFTVAEVATALRLSRMTIYRMVESGQLEGIRTGVRGKTIRIPAASVAQHERDARQWTPVPNIPGQTAIPE